MDRDEKETLKILAVLGGLLCFAAGIAVGALTVERQIKKIDRAIAYDFIWEKKGNYILNFLGKKS